MFFSACGGAGGGGSVSVPALTGEDAASGLNPDPDGFSFPNFGASGSSEMFDETDLVAMFGSTEEVCEGGVASPCRPTAEAAAWARMVNQAREAGHCEGFAVVAASRFVAGESPKTVDLTNEGDVTHALMRGFATQFLKETQDNTKAWAKKSLRDIVATLEASLATGDLEFSLGVYSDFGGHAVLPYAIEFDAPDRARIKIYDSNWPGQERFVDVDLAKDEWRFSFYGTDPSTDPDVWVGGSGDLDITAMSSRQSATCPFCGDGTLVEKSLLVIRSLRPDWTLTTTEGVVTPGSGNTAEASVRPLRSSVAPQAGPSAPVDYVVEVPATGPVVLNVVSPARVSGMTPRAAIEVSSPGGSGGSVTIEAAGISTESPDIQLTLASGNLVASGRGGATSVSIVDESLQLALTTQAGTKVDITADRNSPAVEVIDPQIDGVDYEIASQSGGDEVTRRTFSTDGTESTVTTGGTLEGKTVSSNLPGILKAPDVKPGLPPAAERSISGVQTASTTTTTAGAPAATTTTSTTVASTTTTTAARPTQTTRPVVATTAPGTQTTQAQNASSRRASSITVNVDEWGAALSDPVSNGFSARLSGGAGQLDDVPTCGDVACLESAQAEILGGGVDAATGSAVEVPVTFSMSGVAGPFSVRCGNGGWVNSSGSGQSQSASCSFSNVTSDVVVYLRA